MYVGNASVHLPVQLSNACLCQDPCQYMESAYMSNCMPTKHLWYLGFPSKWRHRNINCIPHTAFSDIFNNMSFDRRVVWVWRAWMPQTLLPAPAGFVRTDRLSAAQRCQKNAQGFPKQYPETCRAWSKPKWLAFNNLGPNWNSWVVWRYEEKEWERDVKNEWCKDREMSRPPKKCDWKLHTLIFDDLQISGSAPSFPCRRQVLRTVIRCTGSARRSFSVESVVSKDWILSSSYIPLWVCVPCPEALFFFPQQQNFAMGSLAQISSGAIRCSFNTRFRTRFRRVLVQIPSWGSSEGTCWGSGGFCVVPEGSGADTLWGSGGFRCRYLVRSGGFRCRYLVWGSGSFRCRYLVRFRKVTVQRLG